VVWPRQVYTIYSVVLYQDWREGAEGFAVFVDQKARGVLRCRSTASAFRSHLEVVLAWPVRGKCLVSRTHSLRLFDMVLRPSRLRSQR